MTSVANDVLVTTGGQFERLISPSSPRLFRHFSCKVLHNAEHVSADRAHLGWRPKLLKGTLESDGVDRLMNQLLQTVASADSAGALINLSRTSDRHRSVGFGFAMFHLLRSRGYLVELIHWNSSHWSEMARGWPNGLLTLLDDQMFAAFPAAVSDEIEEGLDEDPLDKVMDAQDRSAQDRVEDLITEETLADAFDIPGLPADEQERR